MAGAAKSVIIFLVLSQHSKLLFESDDMHTLPPSCLMILLNLPHNPS
jgi:hypothetical protein